MLFRMGFSCHAACFLSRPPAAHEDKGTVLAVTRIGRGAHAQELAN